MEKLKAWSDLCDALKVFGTALMSGECANVEAPAVVPAAPAPKKSKTKKAPEPEPVEDDSDIVDVSEMKMEEDSFDDLEFEDEKQDEPVVTAIDLRYALVDYAKQNGKEAAYKVLGKFGAKRVDDLKESEYSKVLQALKK